MQNFVGVLRAKRFSPNSADLPIMEAVAERLRGRGYSCRLVEEDDLSDELDEGDVYFSMARSERARRKLGGLKRVVNESVALAILSDRVAVYRRLREEGVAQPLSLVWTAEKADEYTQPCWLKSRSAYTTKAGDVRFVSSREDMRACVVEFRERGVKEVLWQVHAAGDLIKFYSVAGTPFLHYCYPLEQRHEGKFGLEQYNGQPKHFTFNPTLIKEKLDRAAAGMRLKVYGADIVVDEGGGWLVIDMNDWPSFRSCVGEAAPHIADVVEGLL